MPMVRATLVFLLPLLAAADAAAQTTFTYHLHAEQTISYDGRDLRAAGPDRPIALLSTAVSPTMVGTTTWMRTFQLPPLEPLSGAMPAGTTITFTLWMRLSHARGVVFPAAAATNMFPGGFGGSTGPYRHYCSASSSTPLTTTLAPYTFSCTVPAAVPIDPTDRFTLWVAFATQSYTPAKGRNGGMNVDLGIEGTLLGAADSRLAIAVP